MAIVNAQSLSLFLLSSEEILWLFFLGVLLSFDFKLWFLLIELHEFGKIELRFLKKLDLSDENVLEWEDFTTLLLDFFANRVRNAKKI
jgi:hypothetical protein